MLDYSPKQRGLQCPGQLSLHFIPQVFMATEAKSHLISSLSHSLILTDDSVGVCVLATVKLGAHQH